MNEGVGGDAAAVDPENAHLQSKEGELLLEPVGNALDPRQSVEHAVTVYPSAPHGVFDDILDDDILDGKSLNQYTGAFDQSDDHSIDDRGKMVEELTVRNYDDATLAMAGCSNKREIMQTARNQWTLPFQFNPGSGGRSSFERVVCRGGGEPLSDALDGTDHKHFSEYSPPKRSLDDCRAAREQLGNNENKFVSSGPFPSGGVRTKFLSNSGFSEFFIKNPLIDRGLFFRGLVHDGCGAKLKEHSDAKPVDCSMVDSSVSKPSSAEINLPSLNDVAESGPGPNPLNGAVTLREWLKDGCHTSNKVDSLFVFRKIVDLVNFYHSSGILLQELRPSSFKLLPSKEVKYIGRCFQEEVLELVPNQNHPKSDEFLRMMMKEQDMDASLNLRAKNQNPADNADFIRRQRPFSSRPASKLKSRTFSTDSSAGKILGHPISEKHDSNQQYKPADKSSSPCVSLTTQKQLITVAHQLEEKWYTSPEELSKRNCMLASNIYHLGIFWFELCSSFKSEQEHVTAMSNLHHRILPREFLSGCPREAGFCLWLLHPEPSSRPTIREILQSDIIYGLQEVGVDEMSSAEEDNIESEILSHFLLSLEGQKRKCVSRLAEEIRCLEGDIEEVQKRRLLKAPSAHSCSWRDLNNGREGEVLGKRPQNPASVNIFSSLSSTNDRGLMKNMNQLESAYFSMRYKIQLPENENTMHSDENLLRKEENGGMKEEPVDPLGALFDGLCKYARYDKFEVLSVLRSGDFINSANVICSLSFDRDEDYFATAGISKKIKIFDFHAVISDSVDIHYPVVEMVNRSKLSCICWNSYIKNYIVSSDYDGIVKLWDVGTGQASSQYTEHQKRAWCVDFSRADPTRFASGSDDHTVKLWRVSEKNSLGTIRTKANVCCVQFSAHSPHLMAFGSADHKTYCYDLRNAKTPWCVLTGHEKTVSYVKFLDLSTAVTASTDNTLKLWDLNKMSSGGLSTDASYLTLTGHTNEKNFVGLSVDDGYIACGSETNEVYAYYKTMPMPITSYRFGLVDPVSGRETEDDGGLFVSSVCWRKKSGMIVAANSAGCIKVLRMV